MKTKIFFSTLLALTFQGCAISDAMLKSQTDQMAHFDRKTDQREQALAKYKKDLTNELRDVYGDKKGYYLSKKLLANNKNIKYEFDSNGNYIPYIEDSVIANEIESLNLHKNTKKPPKRPSCSNQKNNYINYRKLSNTNK